MFLSKKAIKEIKKELKEQDLFLSYKNQLLPEGKKEMPVADFLNGCHISIGDILLNGMDDPV